MDLDFANELVAAAVPHLEAGARGTEVGEGLIDLLRREVPIDEQGRRIANQPHEPRIPVGPGKLSQPFVDVSVLRLWRRGCRRMDADVGLRNDSGRREGHAGMRRSLAVKIAVPRGLLVSPRTLGNLSRLAGLVAPIRARARVLLFGRERAARRIEAVPLRRLVAALGGGPLPRWWCLVAHRRCRLYRDAARGSSTPLTGPEELRT